MGAGEIRAGKAYVEVGADNTSAKAGLQDTSKLSKGVGNEVGALKQKLHELNTDPAALKKAREIADLRRQVSETVSPAGGIQGLRDQLGARSDFGIISKTLAGGGAVAGLTIVGKLLSDSTQKAVELRNEFNAGAKSGGQIADELMGSLPVLGNIWTAGRNIRELLTGEQAALKDITDQADRFTKAISEHRAVLKDVVSGYERVRQITAGLSVKGSLIGMNGPGADWIHDQQAAFEDAKNARAQAAAEVKKIADAAKITISRDDKGNSVLNQDPAAAAALQRKQTLEQRRSEIEAEAQSTSGGPIGNVERDAKKGEREQQIADLTSQINAANTELNELNATYRDAATGIQKIQQESALAVLQTTANLAKSLSERGKDLASSMWDAFGKEEKAKREAVQRDLVEFFDKIENDAEAKSDNIKRDLAEVFDGLENLASTNVERAGKDLDKFYDNWEERIESLLEAGKQMEQQANPAAAYLEALKKINEIHDAGGLSEGTYKRIVDDATREMRDKEVSEFKSRVDELESRLAAGEITRPQFDKKVSDLKATAGSDFDTAGIKRPNFDRLLGAVDRYSTSGTFSSTNLGGLGGGGLMTELVTHAREATKHQKDTADNTKGILDKLDTAGFTFA